MVGHCAVCRKETTEEFVNPCNSNDRAYYCKKHLKSITKSFRCFEELYFLTKNVRVEVTG